MAMTWCIAFDPTAHQLERPRIDAHMSERVGALADDRTEAHEWAADLAPVTGPVELPMVFDVGIVLDLGPIGRRWVGEGAQVLQIPTELLAGAHDVLQSALVDAARRTRHVDMIYGMPKQ